MGEKNFTLIELHLDGNTQFGPKTISDAVPFGSGSDQAAASTDRRPSDENADEDEAGSATEKTGRGSAIGVIAGLVLLVLVAVAVKKVRGGDDGRSIEEEPDVIVN